MIAASISYLALMSEDRAAAGVEKRKVFERSHRGLDRVQSELPPLSSIVPTELQGSIETVNDIPTSSSGVIDDRRIVPAPP